MKNIPDKNNFAELVYFGAQRGIARALAEHKKAGHSIYVWKDNQLVEIPAKKIKFDKKLLKSD